MKFLPIGLEVRARDCIVVGGGGVGARKVRNLLRAEASVTLISPDATQELAHLASTGRIRWLAEAYRGDHLDGAFLAVAATGDDGVNARVMEEARQRGVLVCDASSAERSQVIFGALHQGGGVTVAVFTDGESPSRARQTRDRIAAIQDDWEVAEEGD